MARKQQDDTIVLDMRTLLTPLSILLGSIILSTVLLIGLLSINSNVKNLSGTAVNGTNTGDSNDGTDTGNGAPTQPTTGKVNIDDDPVLGDKKKAKVAIVEFSDYECPFCKRFHQETFDQIVKDYVNTNKAVFVYRDFPLSFHDPLATKEALAANCVKEQKGDKTYFEYGRSIYDATNSNGQGLQVEKLYELANKVGVDQNKFKSCFESEKYKAEVTKDLTDGTNAGISGTPGFIVGVLKDDGTVDGTIVSGAQPYSAFQQAIEEQLAK